MDEDEREDTTIYKVVVNHEEQYSIWPAERENAWGWSDAGKINIYESGRFRFGCRDLRDEN